MKVRLLKRDWDLTRVGKTSYLLRPVGCEKELEPDVGLSIDVFGGIPILTDTTWWLKSNLMTYILSVTYAAMDPGLAREAMAGDSVGGKRMEQLTYRFLDALDDELRRLWIRSPPRIPLPRSTPCP